MSSSNNNNNNNDVQLTNINNADNENDEKNEKYDDEKEEIEYFKKEVNVIVRNNENNNIPLPLATLEDCPEGLQYLVSVDKVFIKQKVELLEAFTKFTTNNQYSVMNENGQVLYIAEEETECLPRQLFGSYRAFNMTVKVPTGEPVLNITRPMRLPPSICWGIIPCWCACLPCWLMSSWRQELNVCDKNGQEIGKISQKLRSNQYIINSKVDDDTKELHVKGPMFTCECLGDTDFQIGYPKEKNQIRTREKSDDTDGDDDSFEENDLRSFQRTVKSTNFDMKALIQKKVSGGAKDFFTEYDTFCVYFPKTMHPIAKAMLISTVFLLDFLYFEDDTGVEVYTNNSRF